MAVWLAGFLGHLQTLNSTSLLLSDILPVKKKHHIFAPTAGARSFPKLCMVIEDVETIKIGGYHFWIRRIVFPTARKENFG